MHQNTNIVFTIISIFYSATLESKEGAQGARSPCAATAAGGLTKLVLPVLLKNSLQEDWELF